MLRQHRTIPALRLKHHSGGCGTASAPTKCSPMSGCGTHIVLREQKPLALCDRCPCFGSLYPPLAALTFAAQSIACAFGLASAAPRAPYRHLELCGIALRYRRIEHAAAAMPLQKIFGCITRSRRFFYGSLRAANSKNFCAAGLGQTAPAMPSSTVCEGKSGIIFTWPFHDIPLMPLFSASPSPASTME